MKQNVKRKVMIAEASLPTQDPILDTLKELSGQIKLTRKELDELRNKGAPKKSSII